MKRIENPAWAASGNVAQMNRMSSDYINSLPIIRFQGKVILINHIDQANGFLKSLKNEKYVGFDTESRPSFSKGISYPPSVIQLATQNTAYLFQLEKIPIFDELVEFFSTPKIKKIGIGIQNDIEKLQEIRKFPAKGLIDLSQIASKKGIIQVGARALTARYLNHRLTKSSQKSNWALTRLTPKQMEYAATDAWICLKIYPILLSDPTDYSQLDPLSPDM